MFMSHVGKAYDMKYNNNEIYVQQQKQSIKTVANDCKIAKMRRISFDSIVNFNFVASSNAPKYKSAQGGSFMFRLHDGADVEDDPNANVTHSSADYDGGLLGDYSHAHSFNTEALLSFKAEQILIGKTYIGVVMEIALPSPTQGFNGYLSGAKSKGAYIVLKNQYVNVQAGATIGAEELLKIDPAIWSAADGGVNSNWIYYANLEGVYIDAVLTDGSNPSTRHRDMLRPFYVTPVLYSQHMSNNIISQRNYDINLAPKVAIYSNEENTIQVGGSYSPHQLTGKFDAWSSSAPVYDNVFGFGIRYQASLNDYEIKCAIAGEFGDAITFNDQDAADYYDLGAISIGASVKYNTVLTVGAEYGNLGRSGLFKAVLKDEDLALVQTAITKTTVKDPSMHYWVIGGAYDFGPVRASASYYQSSKNIYSKVKSDASTMSDINIAAHYNFSYGSKCTKFIPYFAYNRFITKERVAKSSGQEISNLIQDNKGWVFMLGVKVVL